MRFDDVHDWRVNMNLKRRCRDLFEGIISAFSGGTEEDRENTENSW